MATSEPDRRSGCPTEGEIGALPQWAQVALAARAAVRVLPSAGVAKHFAVWGDKEAGFRRFEDVEAGILAALVASVDGAFPVDLASLFQRVEEAERAIQFGCGPKFAAGAAKNVGTTVQLLLAVCSQPALDRLAQVHSKKYTRSECARGCCKNAAYAAKAAVMCVLWPQSGSPASRIVCAKKKAEATEASVHAAMRDDLTELMSTMAAGGLAAHGGVSPEFFDRLLWKPDQFTKEWCEVVERWKSALVLVRPIEWSDNSTRWGEGHGISYGEAVDRLENYGTRLRGDTA